MKDQRKEVVKQYYGEKIQSSKDLKTSACCLVDDLSKNYLKPYINNIHDEILNKFYGCGSPIPFDLKGLMVLDLGCGTGKDCYTISQLVGEKGKVTGIDMTEQQLKIANQYLEYHKEKFGYSKSNIEFKKSYIEDLNSTAHIADNSLDLVISNCVINLSNKKEKVFKEIYRTLKPNGELFFSDIFADRRVPENLKNEELIVGECLGGALYIEDFRRLLQKVGFNDYRITKKETIDLKDPFIVKKIGMIKFYSLTIRTFKCDFEDTCEDYGQVAYYRGTIKESPHQFELDLEHNFPTDYPIAICGNTAIMLSETRYKKHFEVLGNFSKHYGIFDCKRSDKPAKEKASSSCC